MCRLTMLKVLFFVALLVRAGSAGAPLCATSEKIQVVDGIVQKLLISLAASGFVTVDMTTMNVTIPDENLPKILDLLCTTNETLVAMQQLETDVQACPDLLLQSSGLAKLKIKEVGFTEMFSAFGSVDNFCGCRAPLPHAWLLLESKPMLTYQEPSAAYTSIAAVNNLCGQMLKPAIMSIAGRPDSDTCKLPLMSQAGYSTTEKSMKLEKMKKIVDSHCNNFSSADWTCATEKAMMADFKECITTKSNLVGNDASCGKRDCVMDKFDCRDEAKEMYIDAVNLNMTMEIKDKATATECDNSGPGIRISILVLVASLMLTFC